MLLSYAQVAVTVTVPLFTAVRRPFSSIVAIFSLLTDQVAAVVLFAAGVGATPSWSVPPAVVMALPPVISIESGM